MTRTLLTATALALLLAACSDSEPAPAEQGASGAEGEVLGGTISDAMLPLDTVQSQAPSLADDGEESEEGEGEGEGETAEDVEESDAPAE